MGSTKNRRSRFCAQSIVKTNTWQLLFDANCGKSLAQLTPSCSALRMAANFSMLGRERAVGLQPSTQLSVPDVRHAGRVGSGADCWRSKSDARSKRRSRGFGDQWRTRSRGCGSLATGRRRWACRERRRLLMFLARSRSQGSVGASRSGSRRTRGRRSLERHKL